MTHAMSIRIPDDMWKVIQSLAALRNVTATAIVVQALREFTLRTAIEMEIGEW